MGFSSFVFNAPKLARGLSRSGMTRKLRTIVKTEGKTVLHAVITRSTYGKCAIDWKVEVCDTVGKAKRQAVRDREHMIEQVNASPDLAFEVERAYLVVRASYSGILYDFGTITERVLSGLIIHAIAGSRGHRVQEAGRLARHAIRSLRVGELLEWAWGMTALAYRTEEDEGGDHA